MAIITKASLQAAYVSAAVPTETDYLNLIDSTYTGEIGDALVSAAAAGTGVLRIDSASALTLLPSASAGEAILAAGTQASARTAIGAASTSAATTAAAGLIEIATTAEAIAGTNASKAMTPATHEAAVQTIPLPRSYLAGLTLSNGTDATNDIDIAVGECRDTADTANLTVASAIGKQIDVTWAAGGTPGSPTGGMSSSLFGGGAPVNDTTYHVILGLVGGTAEVGFDTSITGANLVTDHSFTNTRRIGSVRRLTATNQVFTQNGDRFSIGATAGFTDSAPAITAETQTIADLITGVKVLANLSVALADTSTGTGIFGLMSSLDDPDVAPSATAHNYANNLGTATSLTTSSNVEVMTNTSAQVRTRHGAAPGGVTLNVSLHGWVDRRGRDG